MKFLVTGGAGFIGSHIVKALVGRGKEVRVLDNLSTGRLENIEKLLPRITLMQADIRDRSAVDKAVQQIDVVLHQAALPSVPRSVKDPVGSHEVNVGGTLSLLEAARRGGVKRFIFASSSSVYGDAAVGRKREDIPADPVSPYALTKHAGEQYCRIYSRLYGLETICLRYFNVFGPHQDPLSEYAAVIPAFIRRIRRGEPPVIFGDGEQSRDFTYVDNVVVANLLAVKARGVAGGVFNIAGGRGITVNQLARTLGRLMGFKGDAIHVESRPGDVLHSRADISRAREDLGFSVRVGFEEGLQKTVRYFLKKRERS
jgi:UDP-glucose 4-epimerase